MSAASDAQPRLPLVEASRRRKRGKSRPLLCDMSGADADAAVAASVVPSVPADQTDGAVDAAPAVLVSRADAVAGSAPSAQVSNGVVHAPLMAEAGGPVGDAPLVQEGVVAGTAPAVEPPPPPYVPTCRCGGCHSGQAPAHSPFRRLHTFCFPDTMGAGRRRPASCTREQFGALLKKRHDDHFSDVYAPGNSGIITPNTVEDVYVCRELHSNGQPHLYGIVLCARPYHAARIANRVRECDLIYMSVSSNHIYLWTAVVYCSVPSAHKAPCEIDNSPWNLKGRTQREILIDFPKGARVSEKQRVAAHLGLPGVAGKCKPPAALLPEELARKIRETVDEIVSEL